jgi:ABC-type cobalamin transport system permease subunit
MMSNPNEARPLADLIGGLFGDLSGLFRKEIQLAKAEASEKLGETMSGVQLLLAGAVLGIGALGVFLAALVSLLAALFVRQGMDPTAASALSAVIVTVVVGLIAWTLANRGIAALKASNLKLKRTASSLGHDADIVKERM